MNIKTTTQEAGSHGGVWESSPVLLKMGQVKEKVHVAVTEWYEITQMKGGPLIGWKDGYKLPSDKLDTFNKILKAIRNRKKVTANTLEAINDPGRQQEYLRRRIFNGL